MVIRIVLFCFLVCACTDADPPRQPRSAAVSVTDATGETVTLAAPATRIIALAPHITENVFSAGAGDLLVGVVEWSDYPEAARSIEIVGGYEKVSHEKIVQLQPDLILSWESGNSRSSIDRLEQLGFTIYRDQPKRLQDVARSIRDIGILSGNEDIANAVADDFLEQIDGYREQYRQVARIPVFYQVWNSPLQSINGDHIISDAIALCGGENIYAKEFAVAPVINLESVLERDPTAIVAGGMSNVRPPWLDEWKKWPSLTAVQQNNLFFVNPDHLQRHTVRLLSGIAEVCRQLDLVRDKMSPSDEH